MRATVVVKAPDSATREQREEAARRVLARFERRLPDIPVLCFFDDEDWQTLRGPGMAANRGVYFRKRDVLFRELPAYVHECTTDGFEDFIYLHGSTCSKDVALAMTFAHELQHFGQHGQVRPLWAANTLAFQTLLHMGRRDFESLGIRACDIPHEREARIVAKQVAEHLFGSLAVGQHIAAKMKENVTDQDAADWSCIQDIVTAAPYDLAAETNLFFPRLESCRAGLQRVLGQLQSDPDFEDLDLDALLKGVA
jgi:hypothetical protein